MPFQSHTPVRGEQGEGRSKRMMGCKARVNESKDKGEYKSKYEGKVEREGEGQSKGKS
jgi:hypothetical protein